MLKSYKTALEPTLKLGIKQGLIKGIELHLQCGHFKVGMGVP